MPLFFSAIIENYLRATEFHCFKNNFNMYVLWSGFAPNAALGFICVYLEVILLLHNYNCCFFIFSGTRIDWRWQLKGRMTVWEWRQDIHCLDKSSPLLKATGRCPLLLISSLGPVVSTSMLLQNGRDIFTSLHLVVCLILILFLPGKSNFLWNYLLETFMGLPSTFYMVLA